MITKKLLSVFGVMLLAAISGFAQVKPGTIASLEYQTPKNGMVKQYEDGRKQKAEWHKQQKDTLPLMVWETISGDHTGTYIVGRLGQHWSDFDKPPIPEQADLDEFNKVIGAYVQSVVTRYYEFLPKDSKPPDSTVPSKFAEIITYRVSPGKEEDFHSAVTRANEAIEKTKWPVHYLWYELANGGRGGTYVLVVPHANWADFEDKPDMKPFPEMLKEAFGPAEADSITKRFDSSIESITSEIIQFRQDLSYLPSK
ncbi:MAG TPA: hypothetical protein VJY15_00620 [Candidatus Acidoferrum sp.]|nr:hypothetical protein [Candidatus Acidoferrum sp.]